MANVPLEVMEEDRTMLSGLRQTVEDELNCLTSEEKSQGAVALLSNQMTTTSAVTAGRTSDN